MAEYIKRSDALEALETMESIEDGLTAMHDIPAADVVEVVRCKKCVSFRRGRCGNLQGLLYPYPDSFCSFGKRRDG